MERLKVKSKAVVAYAYDAKYKVLEMEFPKQVVWHYTEVSPEKLSAMLSGSIGSFFHKEIKGRPDLHKAVKGEWVRPTEDETGSQDEIKTVELEAQTE